MATSLAGLSASVTRILSLTGFPKELKTKDIQTAFSDWEGVNGGFKIKWKDDTSLYIVFQDATVAKKAYLHTLAFPPATLTSPTGTAVIRPYDGPDAQTVIQTVNSRGHNSNPSRSHTARAASISVLPNARGLNQPHNVRTHNNNASQYVTIAEHSTANGREPSPTLPSLPSQPTLNSLISSSLGDGVTLGSNSLPSDPAIVASSMHSSESAPRIGDPGKRMLGAALGVRHPALGPRVLSTGGRDSPQGMNHIQRAMESLVVAE
ncbi:hypothetical protein BDN71DRAFT_1485481 [Pleurotus eryngii]|uniref:Thc1 RRM domain-containing protein n=1 Tax=Pleurotus eryngii TaxID=5323 RepID=A0A9P6AAK0_PLEER|nr:hypothetical protein BDN71DRAFT_1485481 [Pleurotus eryngii]